MGPRGARAHGGGPAGAGTTAVATDGHRPRRGRRAPSDALRRAAALRPAHAAGVSPRRGGRTRSGCISPRSGLRWWGTGCTGGAPSLDLDRHFLHARASPSASRTAPGARSRRPSRKTWQRRCAPSKPSAAGSVRARGQVRQLGDDPLRGVAAVDAVDVGEAVGEAPGPALPGGARDVGVRTALGSATGGGRPEGARRRGRPARPPGCPREGSARASSTRPPREVLTSTADGFIRERGGRRSGGASGRSGGHGR